LEEIVGGHPRVAECAVVGANDEVKGEVPISLIVLNSGSEGEAETIVKEVVQLVRSQLGPVAAFKSAAVIKGLPKTRSGKILRGVIQKIANGEAYKLPGTIEDAGTVEWVRESLRSIKYP
jgi:propionyl-CoA synthetase